MNVSQNTLPRYSLLPTFVPAPAQLQRLEIATPPASHPRPPVLWRDSLAVMADRAILAEAGMFFALAALTLPAAVFGQSTLWHLLSNGVLERAIRLFMLLPDAS